MVLKNRTLTASAMDAQEVGCPDPAAVVDSTEWILRRVATSRRTCASSELSGDMVGCGVFFGAAKCKTLVWQTLANFFFFVTSEEQNCTMLSFYYTVLLLLAKCCARGQLRCLFLFHQQRGISTGSKDLSSFSFSEGEETSFFFCFLRSGSLFFFFFFFFFCKNRFPTNTHRMEISMCHIDPTWEGPRGSTSRHVRPTSA